MRASHYREVVIVISKTSSMMQFMPGRVKSPPRVREEKRDVAAFGAAAVAAS
jgi:hypothetical protein